MALRLAASLWMFWRWAGLFAEGREWLDASLAAAHHAPVDLRVQGLWAAGWLAFHAGEYKRTEELGHELLQLVGGDEDGLRRRHGLTLLGNAALAQDRVDEAVQMLSEAMAVAGEVHSPWHQATSELNLGGALLRANRTDDAHACFERALRIYEDLGDAHFAARALVHLGYIALITGDRAQADRQIPHAMEIFASLGDSWAMAEGFEAVATLVSETAPRAAAVLGGAAEQIRDRIAMRQHPPDAVITQTFLRRAADRLQEEEFAKAWNQGRALTPEAALDLALSL